jgi:hypothetical protein
MKREGLTAEGRISKDEAFNGLDRLVKGMLKSGGMKRDG